MKIAFLRSFVYNRDKTQGGICLIIDIHVHIWGSRLEQDKNEILKAMDRYGIDRVYVSGLQSKISDESEIDFLNAAVAQFMHQHPERIGGAVYVNPAHKNVMDVIKRATQEQGFEMIKLWCCTYGDDPAVDPIMDYAEANGLPVLFHSFKKSTKQAENETTGVHVANIARRHPKTKILMAHFGGSCYHGIPCIRDLPNVWSDQSGTPFMAEELDYALENIGAERMLFGSDNAFLSNIGQVLGADLTQQQRDMIFYQNAQKLLNPNFRL